MVDLGSLTAAELEATRLETMRQYVDNAAFVISAQPYIADPGETSFRFHIPESGDVSVIDPNFEKPQRLANWLSLLVEFSPTPLEPADVMDLALGVQRRLTTEQGEFTTLMILHGVKEYVPKGRKRKVA